MASNRIGRINEEIQKELASLIRNLKDPRVQDTMISITHVEATPDLRYAKVYVSFLQEDRAAEGVGPYAGIRGIAAPRKRRGNKTYLLTSCMAKHSKTSPSLMSLNLAMDIPHS